MTPFITASQLFDRIDWRWVAKNILEGTTSSTSATPPTQAQLENTSSASGARLYQLMADASEKLMAAAAVGARYTENDLRTYGGNLVLSITAGLTIGPILQRRMRAVSDEDALNATYTEANAYVESLRKGERIFFNVPDVPEAGLPDTASSVPRPGIDPPNLSQQATRYFGQPASNPSPWNLPN